jgi:micrococcal nuclease
VAIPTVATIVPRARAHPVASHPAEPPLARRRRARPGPRLLLIALLVMAAVACGHRSTAAGGSSGSGPDVVDVKRVIDGDTIVITRDDDEVRVRLIGIDTPETKKPNTPVECFGPEASARTEALLPPGTPVRLVYDQDRVDTYGRDLAYVYRQADGLFVNLSLVADGFAALDTFPPNVAHVAELTRAATDARQHHRGLWQTCGSGHRAT